MHTLCEALAQAPVIAAARSQALFERAVRSPVHVIFLLEGNPFTLPERVAAAHAVGKRVLIHLDLVEGIARDGAGVRFMARHVRPDGVLSTRAPLLKVAAEEGLRTVLRIFMVDSSSLETGARMVKQGTPDFVEVMPGLVTRALMQMRTLIRQPVIAGGMLASQSDVQHALDAGALAVSTSNEALWHTAPARKSGMMP